MYQIAYLNKLSPKGTALWTDAYAVSENLATADAAVVRSANMHDLDLPESLLAVARAGAGVNNIPLAPCSDRGIVVFNTPGANANSVVELALCGMLLGSRGIVDGINWVKSISGEADVAKLVEKGKGQFAGHELRGKSLGVIGLGAIGGLLANVARRLGMEVYGCDPYISIDAAWHLDSHVIRVNDPKDIFSACDVISLHVPLTDGTRHMVNAEAIARMKEGAVILNFARDALVDDGAMAQALASGKIRCYVTDFPNAATANMPGCIAIPHLGASTSESEDNCAKMAVRQVMDYLENGNITNSVNYPNCQMGICATASRVAVMHRNMPSILSHFTTVFSAEKINISSMMSHSRGEYAYTMMDLDREPSADTVDKLGHIPNVIRVRRVK